jgi:DNA-binding NarL/FixJ family response regulator
MRVVVADDEVLVRDGLARLLEDAGVEVASRCGDATTLLRAVDSWHPDVAIVDIRMPPTHTDEGLVAAQEIRRRHAGIGVLVLSHHLESGYAM